ncbi:hypothetical protein M3Y99_00585300 [Aphelenchoides fujianensis]|nr:hypothetical protein M3Y99_00585300 [Aphelenchoides fujianensis]
MFGRFQAGFSLLLGLSLYVGGTAATGCVMKGTTTNFVTIKTTDGCRSTSTTLVLARESLDFTIWVNGDVHAAKITFKFGSTCSAKMGVGLFGSERKPLLEFSEGTFFPFEVKGALSTSALVFNPDVNSQFKKEFPCSNAFSKRNATHFSLDVAIEWTGEAPDLDVKFHDATIFEYTTSEILAIVGITVAAALGVLLLIAGIAGAVFACRHFKWLCWSGRGKTAPVAQPAVKTAGSRHSQRPSKATATHAPLLPTPTTITPLSRGLTVRDEPPPPTVEQPPAGGKKKKQEPSTITHSIGLTCHDDPPPRRPLGPPFKPNAAKKTVERCGTKTADAFGLHVHDEAPPKTPKRPKSAGLTVQDKSEPTKTVRTGATVVTEEGSKPSKESAPSAPSGSK